jgi:cytochrome P450
MCCAVLLQLPYTEAVIKESLRLMAPGAIATRFTDQQSLQLTSEVRSQAGCPSLSAYALHKLLHLAGVRT